MTIRCIYGCRIQEKAEKAGMKAWCDDHCRLLGYERAFICYAELKAHGIDAKKVGGSQKAVARRCYTTKNIIAPPGRSEERRTRRFSPTVRELSFQSMEKKMPYMMEVCTAGETVEVSKYYSARYGKRGPREQNSKPTSEAAKRINRRQAEKKLRRLMNENFRDKVDALLTLDFSPEERPQSYEEMKRRMQNFLQRLRRRYKKAEVPCRYIWVGEIGPRKGTVHVHMLLSSVDCIGLRGMIELWRAGAVDIKPLWSKGQYKKIASYFLKYAEKTEESTGEHIGRKWNPSHGLRQPKIRKTVVQRKSFAMKVRPWKGYHLEKDKEGNEIRSGVCELTGLPYLQYTMVRD